MTLRTHFRDCAAWRRENLEMSTTSDTAAKNFDQALDQVLAHTDDKATDGVVGAIARMKEADPDFVLAYTFELAISGELARNGQSTLDKIAHLEKLVARVQVNKREKLHYDATVYWCHQLYAKSLRTLEDILFTYPRDTLALTLLTGKCIALGQYIVQRDTLARVLPLWDKTDHDYGYLMHLYAFGLHETNLWERAQAAVDVGSLLVPWDSWGHHTQAHIFESTCKFDEVINYMRKTEDFWSTNNSLGCHNYWHLALSYIEQERYDETLTLYDDKIERCFKSSGVVFNINDGCQLLQRLEFEGVDVGVERWETVYAAYKPLRESHVLAYDDALMLNSFLKSKTARGERVADEFMMSVKDYSKANNGNSELMRDVGVNVLNGISSYQDGDFHAAVYYLLAVKNEIIRMGGSHAQRDLFNQFLIQACLQSKVLGDQDIGRALAYERKAMKSDSPLTERMLQNMLASH